MAQASHSSHGFTLAESLMATVVLAIATAGVATAVSAGQQHAIAALERQRGMMLAESLMEEILSKPYTDPQGGTSLGQAGVKIPRSKFDDLKDYEGFTEASRDLRDAGGELLDSSFQGMTRSVSVTAAKISLKGFSDSMPAMQVVVTVRSRRGELWTLTRLVPEPAP